MNTLSECRINVAKDFSATPGPRKREEGRFSGEEFLVTVLGPRFTEAQRAGVKLVIDLDGGYGYATSFLEEAFGGLARRFTARAVSEVLDFKSDEEPYLIDEIKKYIAEAEQ